MEDTLKIITLASFVLEDKIEGYKKYLYKRFKLPESKIFTYTILEEDRKLITFKVYLKNDKKINIQTFYPSTLIVHKKGDCFYTINALNKLIDQEVGDNIGNINHKDYKINWDNYQGKILLIKSNELIIMNIERNFS